MLGSDGTLRCTPFCHPLASSVNAPDGVQGQAPQSCPALGAELAECLFLWRFVPAERRPSLGVNRVGVCFMRDGFTIDDDGDGVAESVWPSCADRLAVDDDDLGVEPENHELGCAPF